MRSSVSSDPEANTAKRTIRRIAAVIVTYNGKPYIEDCLQSLLAASVEETPTIVVVDNASTDGTADLVRRQFPEVRVLSAKRNLGYGTACNQGAFASQSEYLAIVNQDVVSTPGWMERLVDALDADPSAALAAPKILLKRDPSRINTCGNAPHYTGITTCRGYNQPSDEFTKKEEVTAVSGAAFVIRRTAFDELGGFDPSFFLYLEDTELSLRASLAGYRCLFVPESVVLHDFAPRFSAEKIFFLERNRHMMMLQTYQVRTLLVMAPALLLTELAVWGYSLLRGPRCFWSKLRSYAWIAIHLPKILNTRRRVQALRRVPDSALVGRCTVDLDLDELDHPWGKLVMASTNLLFRSWLKMAQAVLT